MSWLKLLEVHPKEAAKQFTDWFGAFEAEVGADAKKFLPLLTGAAVAAEAVTGNAALIPLTQAAGTGAEQIATLAAAHGNISDVVNTSLEAAKSTAQANGSADAVSYIEQAQGVISSAVAQAAPIVAALQSATAPAA